MSLVVTVLPFDQFGVPSIGIDHGGPDDEREALERPKVVMLAVVRV